MATLQYLPIAPPLFALLVGALVLLLILVQIRVLRYAYMQLGVSSGTAFFLLFASLLGSYVNIPIAALGQETMVTEREVTFFGMRYIVPALVEPPEVILAVNVGGAVIPTLLSIYLLSKNRLWGRGLIAIFCVAAICHALAQPIRGVGIGLPIFVAPLAAAFVAAVVSWRNAAPLAYAGGCLGVLIGADLLNLDKLRGTRGARPLDWRRRHFRWHFRHRRHRGSAGRGYGQEDGAVRSSRRLTSPGCPNLSE